MNQKSTWWKIWKLKNYALTFALELEEIDWPEHRKFWSNLLDKRLLLPRRGTLSEPLEFEETKKLPLMQLFVVRKQLKSWKEDWKSRNMNYEQLVSQSLVILDLALMNTSILASNTILLLEFTVWISMLFLADLDIEFPSEREHPQRLALLTVFPKTTQWIGLNPPTME